MFWLTVGPPSGMLAYILNQNKENSCLHMFVVFNNVGPVSYTVGGPTLKKTFGQNENGTSSILLRKWRMWEILPSSPPKINIVFKQRVICYINRLAINMINDIMNHIPLLQGSMLSPPQWFLNLAHHLRRWPSIKWTYCIKYTKPRYYASSSACASSSASSTQSPIINRLS